MLTLTRVYDAWGVVRFTTGSGASRLGYTGEMQDGTLVYLRARWYHTGLGTFTSRDTYQGVPERPQSLHRYGYTHNNPVMYRDPSGLFCIDVGSGLTFGTTCQHQSVLGDFAESPPVRFAGGFVGRGLEGGRAFVEPLTDDGQAAISRGIQALVSHPQQSRAVLIDHVQNQYKLVRLGWVSVTHHPLCTLGLLSPEDWGSISFDIVGVVIGSRQIARSASTQSVSMPKPTPRIRPPGSAPFDPAKLERILDALWRKEGVTSLVGAERARMLQGAGAKAGYFSNAGGPGTLVFGSSPTNAQVVEELIHLAQHRQRGWPSLIENPGLREALEIEAQGKLLDIGSTIGWTESDLTTIQSALEYWEIEYIKVTHHVNKP